MRLIAAAVAAAAGCGSPRSPARVAQGSREIASNVLRGDYTGSQACGECHRDVYERWRVSPMRNMTRDATTAVIRAPFDGATLRVAADAWWHARQP